MGARSENDQTLLHVRTIGGDELEIEHPALSDETEKILLEQIWEIITHEYED